MLWIRISTGPGQVANPAPTGGGQGFDASTRLIIKDISVLYSNVGSLIIIVIISYQEFRFKNGGRVSS
jgi:hypothetical protein